MTMANSVSL